MQMVGTGINKNKKISCEMLAKYKNIKVRTKENIEARKFIFFD